MTRRCTVCSAVLTWPSVEFCSPRCSEAWIRQAREKEPALVPRGKV